MALGKTRMNWYCSLTQANFRKIFGGASTRQQKLKADTIATMMRANEIKLAVDYACKKGIDPITFGKIAGCINIPSLNQIKGEQPQCKKESTT